MNQVIDGIEAEDIPTMEKIDYAGLSKAKSQEAREAIIDDAVTSHEYICLSDAIANRQRGGSLMLITLDKEYSLGMTDEHGYRDENKKRTWQLKAVRKEDGTDYKPGDVVEWEELRGYRDHRGRKLTGPQVNSMVQRGDRNKLYIKKRHVVDAKGCIECTYNDAMYLLKGFGIHYQSLTGMNGKREFSKHKFEKDDGSKGARMVWAWRFMEVSPDAYAELPLLDKNAVSTDSGETTEDTEVKAKRRGRKPKGEV